jgi:hypothetical protein
LVEGAEKAATALSGLNVEDPSATSTLIGLQEVHVEDSLCTEPTVFAGFWDTRDVQRTETLRTGTQRQWDAQTTDLNALLGDHIIGSGKRPAETDITRIYWLLASGYCPIGTAGYIDTSSPVTLPAADYTGRTAADVLAEASNLSNLNYFVRWEQLASFSDSQSPWLSGLSSYVAPTGDLTTGGKYSSADIWGGRWAVYGGQSYYSPATSASSTTGTLTLGGVYSFGSQQPVANDNPGGRSDNFGFGTGSIYVSQGMWADGRWVWDLGANPKLIATVGIISWLIDVYGAWSVETSEDGITWSVLFNQAQIAAASDSGQNAILTVPANQARHRYWSLHLYANDPGFNTWRAFAYGFGLWSFSSGPGPALGYHAFNWSGDQSSLHISNVSSEIDNLSTFGPDRDAKLTRDPARVYSGVWFEYNGGHVYVSNPTTASNFRPREIRASDLNCTTPAAATNLANAYLARCAAEEDRMTITLYNVPASVVNLVRPGQCIPVKLTHVPGYSSAQWMGVMQRTVTPVVQGAYDVALELAKPIFTGFASGLWLSASLWGKNIGQVVYPATNLAATVPGQTVPPTVIGTGDGSTQLFTLSTTYISGSVKVWVDGQAVAKASITETSATQITLDFAPASASSSAPAQTVVASWQVGS